MEALGEVHRKVWREAYNEAVEIAKGHPRKKGRLKAGDPDVTIAAAAKEKAEEIKNSAYALGKAPEHLTEKQQLKISCISKSSVIKSTS